MSRNRFDATTQVFQKPAQLRDDSIVIDDFIYVHIQ